MSLLGFIHNIFHQFIFPKLFYQLLLNLTKLMQKVMLFHIILKCSKSLIEVITLNF